MKVKSLYPGMNLIDCVRFAHDNDIRWKSIEGTGEYRFESWFNRPSCKVNKRRKDAPRELVKWLGKEIQMLRQPNECSSGISSGASVAKENTHDRGLLYLTFREDQGLNACVEKDSF